MSYAHKRQREAEEARTAYMRRAGFIALVESEIKAHGVTDSDTIRMLIIDRLLNSEYKDTVHDADICKHSAWKKAKNRRIEKLAS